MSLHCSTRYLPSADVSEAAMIGGKRLRNSLPLRRDFISSRRVVACEGDTCHAVDLWFPKTWSGSQRRGVPQIVPANRLAAASSSSMPVPASREAATNFASLAPVAIKRARFSSQASSSNNPRSVSHERDGCIGRSGSNRPGRPRGGNRKPPWVSLLGEYIVHILRFDGTCQFFLDHFLLGGSYMNLRGLLLVLLAFTMLISSKSSGQDAADKPFPVPEAAPLIEHTRGLISRIAFGSCGNQNKSQPILKQVIDRKPDLFCYLGDNIYGDSRTLAVLRAKYLKLA